MHCGEQEQEQDDLHVGRCHIETDDIICPFLQQCVLQKMIRPSLRESIDGIPTCRLIKVPSPENRAWASAMITIFADSMTHEYTQLQKTGERLTLVTLRIGPDVACPNRIVDAYVMGIASGYEAVSIPSRAHQGLWLRTAGYIEKMIGSRVVETGAVQRMLR